MPNSYFPQSIPQAAIGQSAAVHMPRGVKTQDKATGVGCDKGVCLFV